MRSKATVAGHPIHPGIVGFPIAFLVGALVCDAIAWASGNPDPWTPAGRVLNVAGLLTAVIAIIPGIIDYVASVPPRSSAKTRGFRHMVVNLGAVALFAHSWFFRHGPSQPPGLFTVFLELAGTCLLAAGTWMGGTMVGRNMMGVEHRYARAGRWKDEKVPGTSGQAVTVAKANELEIDQMKLVRVAGRRIVLARTEQGYVAFDDHCTHRGASLADGVMICGTVQCLWHGSQFDVRSGQVKAGPAREPIPTYQLQETGTEIRLVVP